MAKEHFLEQHDPERGEFQVDRIVLFSDAVFAIAITLLIIEIKPPEVKSISTDVQAEQLSYLIPKFIGFILSFFVVAIYWRSHHRIFGFVNRYSNKLIFLNFIFLFWVVVMPFSSAYYSENTAYNLPFYFYNFNIVLTGLANVILIRYVLNPKNALKDHEPSLIFKKLFMARAISIPSIFLIGMLVCPYSMMIARMCPILIWPVFIIIHWLYRRRYMLHVNTDPEEKKTDESEISLS